jgi:hypothetical protein
MPDQVGIGDAAIDHRDPRFAELDAQIKAEQVERQQKQRPAARKRQRAGPALPREIRKDITQFTRQLKRQHRHLFNADPKLKDRVARFLRSVLPPQRKRGRPGIPGVTKAIVMLKKFKRQYSREKPEQIWRRIYPEAIPGYASMDREQQKAERLLLRERVRSRRQRQQTHRTELQ